MDFERGYQMNILIIGGTTFVGRHIVEAAIHKDYEITLFNRGISNPDVFPELPHIIGDRKKDAEKLAGQKWDAVIDTCAFSPEDLMPVLKHLDTDFYVFISTISVYNDYKSEAPSETSKTIDAKLINGEAPGKIYGMLKAQAEKIVLENLGDGALIIRPSIVAGPHDPTDRFTFWAEKFTKKEKVLVPGAKTRKVQWIDARDLAVFIMKQLETKTSGIFNVAADSVEMEAFIDALSTGQSEDVWVDDAFLVEQGIEPFDIPLWIPTSEEHPEGFIAVKNAKAKRAGLECRSAKETANDIRDWLKATEERPLKASLSRERELALLKSYKSSHDASSCQVD